MRERISMKRLYVEVGGSHNKEPWVCKVCGELMEGKEPQYFTSLLFPARGAEYRYENRTCGLNGPICGICASFIPDAYSR